VASHLRTAELHYIADSYHAPLKRLVADLTQCNMFGSCTHLHGW